MENRKSDTAKERVTCTGNGPVLARKISWSRLPPKILGSPANVVGTLGIYICRRTRSWAFLCIASSQSWDGAWRKKCKHRTVVFLRTESTPCLHSWLEHIDHYVLKWYHIFHGIRMIVCNRHIPISMYLGTLRVVNILDDATGFEVVYYEHNKIIRILMRKIKNCCVRMIWFFFLGDLSSCVPTHTIQVLSEVITISRSSRLSTR